MRIDKYLKVTRLVKRRSVAKDLADHGKITVAGKPVKASYDVKIDDEISVQYGRRKTTVKVLDLKEAVRKEDVGDLYDLVGVENLEITMKKIDCHMHITPPELIRDYKKIYDQEPYWALLGESKNNRFATGEMVVENLEEAGFDKGICFGFSFKDIGLCAYVNDYTAEMMKQYPDVLVGHMAISPKAKGAVKEAERAYDLGLLGVGELFLSGQGIDPFSKEDLKPLMDFCLERDLVVNIHSNEPVGHYYPGKVEVTPKEIAAVAMNFPENKIVTAHFGGGLPFYEMMKEMSVSLKNVYYDTAAGIYLYDSKIFNVLKTIGVLDKVVFGSDFPLLSVKRYEKYFINAGLSQEDQEKILGGNAMAIYNI